MQTITIDVRTHCFRVNSRRQLETCLWMKSTSKTDHLQWKSVVRAVLRQSPDQELPIKSLRKKCRHHEWVKTSWEEIWTAQSIHASPYRRKMRAHREHIYLYIYLYIKQPWRQKIYVPLHRKINSTLPLTDTLFKVSFGRFYLTNANWLLEGLVL